jgi:hypothetical protein
VNKPRNRLTIGPLKADDVEAARQAMWAAWIKDCERVRDEWIEARLGELEGFTNG